MRKVRYIQVDSHISYYSLTNNKVYDVINNRNDILTLLDDDGFKDYFTLHKNDGVSEFIDVTSEYRSEVIDSILM